MSPMDMVLIASVNPYIARILGLYWVDETAIDEVYDYKIECIWLNKLWNLENIVDFDKDTVEKQFFNIFKKDSFVFINTGIAVIDLLPSSFARAKKGLHISHWKPTSHITTIHCTESIRELQFFVRHQEQSVTLEAFHNGILVDSFTLTKPEGVLAVHYEQNIDYVTLRAKDIIIYKICWSRDYLGDTDRTYIVCGVKKGTPQPLDVPTGLKAFPLPGMTKTLEDNTLDDRRFGAGLIWNIPKNATGSLLGANAAILYHVQHRTPLGEVLWPTENSPVKVIPESFNKLPLWLVFN